MKDRAIILISVLLAAVLSISIWVGLLYLISLLTNINMGNISLGISVVLLVVLGGRYIIKGG